MDAVRDGREPDVPEPTSTPLTAEDFRDAGVVFAFRANAGKADGSDEKFLARLWRDLYPGESSR